MATIVGIAALAACGDDATRSASTTSTTAAELSGFPVTITNCGRKTTYDRPPSRIASLDQIMTEVLVHLGLQGSIVGRASEIEAPFAGGAGFASIADAYARIPSLAEAYPSQEVLLNATPDFVSGNADAYSFGPKTNGGSGFTRAEMERQGIGTFTLQCSDETQTNELMFTRYEDLGRIFGREAAAEELVAKSKRALASTARALEGTEPTRTMFYVSGKGPLTTYGGGGGFDASLKLAGGDNVFGKLPSYPTPTVSAEKAVASNPDAIVTVAVGSLDSSDPSPAEKRAFLVETLGSSVSAVRRDRFCDIGFSDFTTGPRLATSVAKLAACLHPDVTFP